LVKKHDGRREQFNREKLKAGLIRASEKTKVSFDDIARITDEIERDLRFSDSGEVESKHIGDIAAKKLKKIDKIAYIRFASVFKRFLDVEDFERELKKLIR
jgi:transcriptional repressor NrdR